jgi:hypothetical protein
MNRSPLPRRKGKIAAELERALGDPVERAFMAALVAIMIFAVGYEALQWTR